MPGLLKIWIKGLKQSGSNRHRTRSAHTNHVRSNIKTFQVVDIFEIARDVEAGFFGEWASVLGTRLWTVADAPSRVSHMCTRHRRCSRIFCTASHTVGDNKLCGIYLIFHLDLNYIIGSQRQWTVFELLDIYLQWTCNSRCVVKKIGIIQVSLYIFIH